MGMGRPRDRKRVHALGWMGNMMSGYELGRGVERMYGKVGETLYR